MADNVPQNSKKTDLRQIFKATPNRSSPNVLVHLGRHLDEIAAHNRKWLDSLTGRHRREQTKFKVLPSHLYLGTKFLSSRVPCEIAKGVWCFHLILNISLLVLNSTQVHFKETWEHCVFKLQMLKLPLWTWFYKLRELYDVVPCVVAHIWTKSRFGQCCHREYYLKISSPGHLCFERGTPHLWKNPFPSTHQC